MARAIARTRASTRATPNNITLGERKIVLANQALAEFSQNLYSLP